MAEHGKTERPGWVALDKIQLSRAECELEPKEAAPPTFPPPTESTTLPINEDVFCNFQENNCNFTIDGSGDFKFERTKASSVGLIGEDHNHSPDGMILFAEAKSDSPDNVWTSVVTNLFKGDDHVIECFHFWFFIDGFLVNICIWTVWINKIDCSGWKQERDPVYLPGLRLRQTEQQHRLGVPTTDTGVDGGSGGAAV